MNAWIQNAYHKLIGSKFLNKIQFAYFAIVIITMGFLVSIVSTSVASILKDQALNYNMQILMTIDQYFEGQCRSAKTILQQIIEDTAVYDAVTGMLSGGSGQDVVGSQNAFLSINASMRSKMSIYSDIEHIYLYDLKNSYKTFYLSADQPSEKLYSSAFMKIAQEKSAGDSGSARLFSCPAVSVNGHRIFCMYDYIRDKNDYSAIMGSILFDYDTRSVEQSYSLFQKYLKGCLLLLDDDGEVLYDSSGINYGKVFPMFALISGAEQGTIPYDGGLISVVRNGTFHFISVGVIPDADLYKDINATKRNIYLIGALCIACILIITYFSTKLLSRRMGNVIAAIHKIQKGDFNSRIKVMVRDELGEISQNLNDMCGKITEYIEREYVTEIRIKDAELKQKETELKQNEAALSQQTAELVALQTQIDPHFLYNTLEVIRMHALSGGECDAAKMIESLAAMYRRSVKSDVVVHISEEIEFCRSYLELFNIRFAGMLRFGFDMEEEIREYGIIRHLLQPIIENAIVHGLDLNREGNVVEIKGRKAGDVIRITITDNGKGMSEDELQAVNRQLSGASVEISRHIGIANVNSRIKLLYGEGYGLEVRSARNTGTLVVITVSVKTKEELLRYVQRFNSR